VLREVGEGCGKDSADGGAMRAWEVSKAYGVENLRLSARPEPRPGAGQIVVGIKAAGLNYRDLLMVDGQLGQFPLPLVPVSDGAGEVFAIGDGVSRVQVGDKVCPLFFQSWLQGPATAERLSRPLAGPLDGVAQEKMLVDAEGVAKFPTHLSFAEAATLPCAGVTAWRAVGIEAKVAPGDTVLVQGTGGVSTFALQFAKRLGATVIVTSSSDAKLQRAKALGADHLINYRATPDWASEALRITQHRGVDVVIEVGGESTFDQSLEAVRVGGQILVIGVLGGFSTPVVIPKIFGKNVRIQGISIGNREHFEDMASRMAEWKLIPAIDKVFPFSELPVALGALRDGNHVGKLVIQV